MNFFSLENIEMVNTNFIFNDKIDSRQKAKAEPNIF